jgi:hypothetical protein
MSSHALNMGRMSSCSDATHARAATCASDVTDTSPRQVAVSADASERQGKAPVIAVEAGQAKDGQDTSHPSSTSGRA